MIEDAGAVMMHPNQLTVEIGTVRALVAEWERGKAWAFGLTAPQ